MHKDSTEGMLRQNIAGSFHAATLDSSRLAALLESAQLLHTSLDLKDLLRHLLRTVMGRTLSGRGMIAVEEDGVMTVALARGMRKLVAGALFDEALARSDGIDIFFRIGAEDMPAGVLGVSQPPEKEIEQGELQFVRALLGIAAGGINQRLLTAYCSARRRPTSPRGSQSRQVLARGKV